MLKEIIEENRKAIYRLPTQYKDLLSVLENEEVRTLYLSLLRLCNRIDCFLYDGKYSFFLDTNRLTGITKTNKARSNQRINYLVAVGLIGKHKQQIHEEVEKTKLTDTNWKFIRYKIEETGRIPKMGVSVYYLKKLDSEALEKANGSSHSLIEKGITVTNISFNQLMVCGLDEVASRVYPNNRIEAVTKKKREYEEIIEIMKMMISEKEYVTKNEIVEKSKMPKNETEKVLKIFKKEIEKKYVYKAPTNEECSKYGLLDKKWIYTKGGKNGEKRNKNKPNGKCKKNI